MIFCKDFSIVSILIISVGVLSIDNASSKDGGRGSCTSRTCRIPSGTSKDLLIFISKLMRIQ